MSFGHNALASALADRLARRLPKDAFRVFEHRGRFRAPNGDADIPDVAVVWPPKTGTYDVDTKLPADRLRGDAEIWRLHPTRRSITIWRRQDDGSDAERTLRSGTRRLLELPMVGIDLAALFASE